MRDRTRADFQAVVLEQAMHPTADNSGREMFEAFCKKQGWSGRDLDCNARGEYIEEGMQLAWAIWQHVRGVDLPDGGRDGRKV